MNAKNRASRWKEYFGNLLNTTIPNNPIPYTTFQGAKLFINNITQDKVNVALMGLRNWKAPEFENIPLELQKYGKKNFSTQSLDYMIKFGQKNGYQ